MPRKIHFGEGAGLKEGQDRNVAFRDLLNLLRPSAALSPNERRSTVRLRCNLDVLLWVDNVIHNASVVDVTLTGLSLEVEKPIALEQMVSLARDDFGRPWQGEVVWCRAVKGTRGYRVGVRYPADHEMMRSSWLEPALKQTGFEVERPDERRRLRRVSGRVPCQLRGLTGDLYTEGEMLDLSLGGAKVESDVEFPAGLSLAFETLPQGGLPPLQGIAKVASCRPAPAEGRWLAGLRFTETREEDVLKYMSSMVSSRWSER